MIKLSTFRLLFERHTKTGQYDSRKGKNVERRYKQNERIEPSAAEGVGGKGKNKITEVT